MTHFRVRYRRTGEHVHARVFSSRSGQHTFANNGELCFLETEWNSFLQCFQDRAENSIIVIPDDGAE
jgi:hypothetical protein